MWIDQASGANNAGSLQVSDAPLMHPAQAEQVLSDDDEDPQPYKPIDNTVCHTNYQGYQPVPTLETSCESSDRPVARFTR